MSVNKVILIGNIGKDPEIRYTNDNSKVASFALATTEKYKAKDGTLIVNTDWHNIVAWRQLADVIEKYTRKGARLYVEGRLKTESYEVQGQKRTSVRILADKIELLDRKTDSDPAVTGARQMAEAAKVQEQPVAQAPAVDDDGFPF